MAKIKAYSQKWDDNRKQWSGFDCFVQYDDESAAPYKVVDLFRETVSFSDYENDFFPADVRQYGKGFDEVWRVEVIDQDEDGEDVVIYEDEQSIPELYEAISGQKLDRDIDDEDDSDSWTY